MRKLISIILLTLSLFCFLAGCKAESTTILNTETKLFYGGSQIEVTVRELKVDGGKTTARIRFLNLGTEELGSIQALVEFIDKDGNTIKSTVLDDTFDTPVAVGESFSETAECDSSSKITGVYVAEYVPES
ncbi:MAG: hypothetical protein VB062_07895 [Christensenella sp.]|nr:hypothetical protein [Christensenella sp.]